MKRKKFLWGGIAAAIITAGFLSPFASSFPDGLERAAEDLGFDRWAQDNPIAALIPDYAVPGVSHQGIAAGLAGVVGVLIVFALTYLLGRLVSHKNTRKAEED